MNPIAKYVGGEVVQGINSNKFAPGIPAGTTTIWIMARGGVVYATLNGAASAATSPVYIPDGAVRIYGPFNNVHALGLFMDTNTYAHITYEEDKLP